jgi:DNA-binding response OmpR family regulator
MCAEGLGCNRGATAHGAILENVAMLPARRGRPHRRKRGMRVLVIEDDEQVAEGIAVGLRRAGMAVDVAFDGTTGLDLALPGVHEVVVLDRDLPGLHGDKVCAALVQRGCPPRILMLTAAADVDNKVEGLAMGADDYLPKPFALAELVARIRALVRRSQPALPPVLAHADLELDTARHQLRRKGQRVELGPKEFGVLEALLSARGRVVSSEELLDRVWDDTSDPATTAVKVTVSRLRHKLGDPPVVQTVGTLGYRLVQ